VLFAPLLPLRVEVVLAELDEARGVHQTRVGVERNVIAVPTVVKP
jgi:hypothetical protein